MNNETNNNMKYLVVTLDESGINEEAYNTLTDVNEVMKSKTLRQELGWGYETVIAYKLDKEGYKTDLNHKLTIS